VTAPRRLREWEQAHDSLSELASRLSVKKYQEALDEAYRGPTGQGNGRTTGGSVSDPTTTALQSTSRKRGALRRSNEKLTEALFRLEEAAEELEKVTQGPSEIDRAGYLRLAQSGRSAGYIAGHRNQHGPISPPRRA
jgi:hypothetical protein